jgi:hypothetical protein
VDYFTQPLTQKLLNGVDTVSRAELSMLIANYNNQKDKGIVSDILKETSKLA